jgi:hypothetical protein
MTDDPNGRATLTREPTCLTLECANGTDAETFQSAWLGSFLAGWRDGAIPERCGVAIERRGDCVVVSTTSGDDALEWAEAALGVIVDSDPSLPPVVGLP